MEFSQLNHMISELLHFPFPQFFFLNLEFICNIKVTLSFVINLEECLQNNKINDHKINKSCKENINISYGICKLNIIYQPSKQKLQLMITLILFQEKFLPEPEFEPCFSY